MEIEKIKYRKGFKYQLAEIFAIQTDIKTGYDSDYEFLILAGSGILTIRAGYAWDGPSGPAIDTRNFMRASLVHDAFYQLMRVGVIGNNYRKKADYELYRMCREDGMTFIRAKWCYLALRLAAGNAASPESVKKILEAP